MGGSHSGPSPGTELHPQTRARVGSGKPGLSRDLQMLLLCGARADFAMSQGFQPRQMPSSTEPPGSPRKSGQAPPPLGPGRAISLLLPGLLL